MVQRKDRAAWHGPKQQVTATSGVQQMRNKTENMAATPRGRMFATTFSRCCRLYRHTALGTVNLAASFSNASCLFEWQLMPLAHSFATNCISSLPIAKSPNRTHADLFKSFPFCGQCLAREHLAPSRRRPFATRPAPKRIFHVRCRSSSHLRGGRRRRCHASSLCTRTA